MQQVIGLVTNINKEDKLIKQDLFYEDVKKYIDISVHTFESEIYDYS